MPREAAAGFGQAAHAYAEAVDRETGPPVQRLARLDPDVLGGLWASFFALRQAVGEPPPARATLVAAGRRVERFSLEGVARWDRPVLDAPSAPEPS